MTPAGKQDKQGHILDVHTSSLRHASGSERIFLSKAQVPLIRAKDYGCIEAAGVSPPPSPPPPKLSDPLANASTDKHSESRRQYLPDAAAVHCLQGKLWHAHHDFTKAIESYAEALRLNPFMWDAFIGLSDLGTQ